MECLRAAVIKLEKNISDEIEFTEADAQVALSIFVRNQILRKTDGRIVKLKIFMAAVSAAYRKDPFPTSQSFASCIAHLCVAQCCPETQILQFVKLVTGKNPSSLYDLFNYANNKNLAALQSVVMRFMGSSLTPDILFTFARSSHLKQECTECYIRNHIEAVDSFLAFLNSIEFRPNIERRDLWRIAELIALKDERITTVQCLTPPLQDLADMVSSMAASRPAKSNGSKLTACLKSLKWFDIVPLVGRYASPVTKKRVASWFNDNPPDLCTLVNKNGIFDVFYHLAQGLEPNTIDEKVSAQTYNFAKKLAPSPVAFEMCCLSLNLSDPRRYLRKLQLSILAIDLAPGTIHIADVVDKLSKAFVHDQPKYNDHGLTDWMVLAATIAKLKNRDVLVDYLLEQTHVGPEILALSQHYLLEASSKVDLRKYMHRSMALLAPRKIHHHEVFYRSTRQVWSPRELEALNCKEGYMLLAMRSSSAEDKYRYCKLAVQANRALPYAANRFNLSHLVWVYGFANLSSQTEVDYFYLFRSDEERQLCQAPDCTPFALMSSAERSNSLEESMRLLMSLESNMDLNSSKTAFMIDSLVRVYFLNEDAGNAGDARNCIKQAISMAKQANLPVRHTAMTLMLRKLNTRLSRDESTKLHYGPDIVKLGEELERLYLTFHSEKATAMGEFQSEHTEVMSKLTRDPVYAVLSEVALSEPCATSMGDVKAGRTNQKALKPLQDLTNKLLDVEPRRLKWKDRSKRAQILGSSQLVLESLSSPTRTIAGSPCTFEVEKCKRSFLRAARIYNGHKLLPKTDDLQLSDLPDSVIALTINRDMEDNLVIGKYQKAADPFIVTLPTSRMQSLGEGEDELTIPEGLKMLADIVAYVPPSVEAKAREPEAVRLWWEEQLSKEERIKKVLRRMEESWLGGFVGLFDPFDRQDTSHFASLTSSLESTIARNLSSTNLGAHKSSGLKIRPEIVSLFASIACGPRLRREESAIEDLLYFVLDNLRLQGIHLDYDDVDIDQLVIDVQTVVHAYRKGQEDQLLEAVDELHIVLIPDTSCHAVPWECLPSMENVPFSRALSLGSLVEMSRSRFYAMDRPPAKKGVYYIVNPENDLPTTQETFEAPFRLRKWTGLVGKRPTDADFATALADHACLIYIGHGNGMTYVRGATLRAAKPETCPPVMLLGCGSAKLDISGDGFDSQGAITDYAVGGCPLFIGNLWNVKDKDFNRLCTELFGRVFDDGEEVCRALMQARKGSILHYLTGAAPVIFGLPTTLA